MADRFNVFDKVNQALLQISEGDRDEAELLRMALDRSETRVSAVGTARLALDNVSASNFRRSFLTTQSNRGGTFRDAHRLSTDALRINARQVAFTGPPDEVREEHSAFCFLMYRGFQLRFLDRHPGETPEEFLDRPRKRTLNVTRTVIDILSQLYRKRPTRMLEEETDEEIKEALGEIWSDTYDLELLEVDRYTRLEGTVGVRPFFDPEAPGKIRLWTFHSHQLRVIPNPDAPWKPLAVIERHEPFRTGSRVVIWTEKSFAQVEPNGTVVGGPHTLGRIPITFFRDSKAIAGSFFAEGRGRGLCDSNANINGKLTDLNEIFQYQGFAVPEVVNASEDELTLGPRRPVRFDDVDQGQPFGINFKNPNAPLAELRAEVEADVQDVFREHRISPSAFGVDISRRTVSGVSIRESRRPLLDDFKERGRLFTPFDKDLADNCLRVRAEHDDAFAYNPALQKPEYHLDWQEPDLPLQTRDQIAKDDFDVAQGMRTPPELMRRDQPGRWTTIEGATEAWQENLQLLLTNPRPEPLTEEDGPGDAFEEHKRESVPVIELAPEADSSTGQNGRSLPSPTPILDVFGI